MDENKGRKQVSKSEKNGEVYKGDEKIFEADEKARRSCLQQQADSHTGGLRRRNSCYYTYLKIIKETLPLIAIAIAEKVSGLP